ncbi:MAG: hypothetical protein RL582_1996 [Bacteroidota bacterium]
MICFFSVLLYLKQHCRDGKVTCADLNCGGDYLKRPDSLHSSYDFLLLRYCKLACTARMQKVPHFRAGLLCLSGWQDSNLRPPGPKPGAITGLRYIPKVGYLSTIFKSKKMFRIISSIPNLYSS